MFVKTTNLSNAGEITINTDFIVSFQGANEGKATLISMSTGDSYVIDMTPRSLRFIVNRKAKQAPEADKAEG